LKLYTLVFCGEGRKAGEARQLTEFPTGVPGSTTHFHFDGNNMAVLLNTSLTQLVKVTSLNLNRSDIEVIQLGSFNVGTTI
jgi:hypothetical protein